MATAVGMERKTRIFMTNNIFKIAVSIVLIAALLLGWLIRSERNAAALVTLGNIKIEYLLSPSQMYELGTIGEDFDVASSGSVILRGGNDLYQINGPDASDSTGRVPLKGPLPDSFAVDSENTLLTIADGFFGLRNEAGEIQQAVPLPYDHMRLARSRHRGAVYLFGGANNDYRLYHFSDNGDFHLLFQSDKPIQSVTDSDRWTYLATDNLILRIDQDKPTVIYSSPKEDGADAPITSITVSADDAALYFSTPTEIFLLTGAVGISIVNNSGGELRLRNGKLYALDRTRGMLYTAQPQATSNN